MSRMIFIKIIIVKVNIIKAILLRSILSIKNVTIYEFITISSKVYI